MTIALVQTAPVASGTGASSTTFSGNTTAGNTVILTVNSYSNAGAAITSDTPVFGGSSFAGAVKLFDQLQPTGSGNIYGAVWMFPNVPAGTTVGVTIHNGTVDANVGATAREFSGLGTAPTKDQGSTGHANSAGPADSGTTGAITSAPELVCAAVIMFGSTATGPGAPWSNENTASGFGVDGYQIVTSSGGTYDYQATLSGTNNWAAGIATIAVTATPAVSAIAAFGDTDVSWEKLQLLGVV